MRGVCLLLWLKANPRARVPINAKEGEDMWESGLWQACISGHLETDVEAVSLTAAGTLPAMFTRQQVQTYRTQHLDGPGAPKRPGLGDGDG